MAECAEKILDVKKNGVFSYSIYLEPDFDRLPDALEPLRVEDRRLCLYTSKFMTLWGRK